MIVSLYNSPLKAFKAKHDDEAAIIFATGPSLGGYKPFSGSDNCIKVGLNRIYDNTDILDSLDYYYFGSGYYLDPEHRKNIDAVCRRDHVTAFASAYEEGRSHGDIGRGNISPEDARAIGAIPFENNLSFFTNDVSNFCTLGHSIVFPPLQHMLYMGVKTIYLVGCDCGATLPQYGPSSGDPHLLNWWRIFKEFKLKYYPDVKIISVNPVSLQGWFDDIFTP